MMWEVARREIVTRGRTRAYRVITAMLLLAAIAAPLAVALWPESDESLPELVYGAPSTFTSEDDGRLDAYAREFFDVRRSEIVASDEMIAKALQDGAIDVYILSDNTLRWASDNFGDGLRSSILFGFLQQQSILERGSTLGLDPADTAALFAPIQINEEFLEEPDEAEGVAVGLAGLGLFISFLLPQVYGNLILMGVVEEKSTRVVEVLLSHVRPRTLLGGKVLGIGALALAQFAIVIAGLTAALALTDQIDIPAEVWRTVPLLAVFVIFGFALYGTLFALFGSLISRQEDAAQVMIPLLVPIMGGFFVGQAVVGSGIDPWWVRALSLFPLTSPMLIPVRAARGLASGWEVALAFALLAVSIVLVVRLAGKVYEFTLLRTGSPITLREALGFSKAG